jgi:predicted ATP-grasp superfamily ATP-dependent carboligase
MHCIIDKKKSTIEQIIIHNKTIYASHFISDTILMRCNKNVSDSRIRPYITSFKSEYELAIFYSTAFHSQR